MAGRKRKILTLQERVKVVDRLEKGESARMIATSLAVGKTQIQAIAMTGRQSCSPTHRKTQRAVMKKRRMKRSHR